jgi:hypothetical protein
LLSKFEKLNIHSWKELKGEIFLVLIVGINDDCVTDNMTEQYLPNEYDFVFIKEFGNNLVKTGSEKFHNVSPVLIKRFSNNEKYSQSFK